MLRLVAAILAVAVAAPALAADPETNKKIVVEFYDKALNQKDFEAASKYFGPRYVQHNPNVPDGIESFKGLVTMLKEKFPNSHNEIKRAVAEGDLVVLHVHSVREPGQRGRAIVDIFRLENGKIVEHWDVIQDVPEKAANTNTMF
jgi:predicted SnoaL-like aldol condensation-catalyzing enzyme